MRTGFAAETMLCLIPHLPPPPPPPPPQFASVPHPRLHYCTHPRLSRFPQFKMAAGISARAQNKYACASAGYSCRLTTSTSEPPEAPSWISALYESRVNLGALSFTSNSVITTLAKSWNEIKIAFNASQWSKPNSPLREGQRNQDEG